MEKQMLMIIFQKPKEHLLWTNPLEEQTILFHTVDLLLMEKLQSNFFVN